MLQCPAQCWKAGTPEMESGHQGGTQVTQVPSHFQKAPEVRPWHHLAEGGLAIHPPETSNLCLKILMRLMSLKIGQKSTANAVKMREEIGRRQRPLDFWWEGNAPKIGQRKLSR